MPKRYEGPKIAPDKEMDLLKTRMKAMGVSARVSANKRAADSLVENIRTAAAQHKAGQTAKATATLKAGPRIKAYVRSGTPSGGGIKDLDDMLRQHRNPTKYQLN